MFQRTLLPWLIWVFYRTLSFTWRVSLVEPPELLEWTQRGFGGVLAHWHGDELVLLSLIGKYNCATMTSTSKDGNLMDVAIRLQGGKTSRGSSTKGAVGALKGLIRLIKCGHNACIAVDGPKGPLHKIKPGVFEISRLTKTPILAAGVACDRAVEFPRSWNKTFLPKPFARVGIVWTPALDPITRDQDPKDQSLVETLEAALHRARQQALKLIAPCKR